ncbi:MAG TPA: hypothetical protein VHB30_05090 [Solirubrobacteraceae bacterium]|jgi:hypothetical protein|nr:hypothetical protein [Solirubrobacteraceae bacterium]
MGASPAVRLAVVAALICAAAGCGGGAVAPDGPAAGWTTFRDDAHGLTVRFPSSWHRATRSLTPYLAGPKEILSLGTFRLRRGDARSCAQMPMGAVETARSRDVFLSVQELAEHGNGPSRRHPFALGRPVAAPGLECVGTSPRWRSYWLRFDDAGRGFYLLALVGRDAPPARVHELHEVLDDLRFERR